ncbi:MAG: DNA methyltransferase [Candidatus Hodarchaeales archaeon]
MDKRLKDDKTMNTTVIHADIYAALDSLETSRIDCVITSPPYWNQRDYGFAHQIGSEKTQEEYIARLVKIFVKLKDKMHSQGVFFLNIGDKYINKYGNTPLGMIPYKLAYWMTKHGWNLEDIIIWYKPNHMPSSVSNRFTNTYEPVFVFTKSDKNYYKDYKHSQNYRNILKIPLQQLPYKHMASFPEKLVEKLVSDLNLPDSSVVLDPFAGSGTTAKAMKNLERNEKKGYKIILIEAFKEYIDIILDRCNLSRKAVVKVPFRGYKYDSILTTIKSYKKELISPDFKSNISFNIESDLLYSKLIDDKKEVDLVIESLINDYIFDQIDDDGIVFIGLPNHDIRKIFKITQLSRWIIRNMIVISYPGSVDWFPLFFLVKDIKSLRYKFNIDLIRVNHSLEQETNWKDMDFVGYKVTKAGSYFKNPNIGLIAKILKKRNDGLPKWVIVKWDDSSYSVEEIINPPVKERKTLFMCPKCSKELEKYYHTRKEITCSSCNLTLWKNLDSIPKLLLNEKNPPVVDLKSMKLVVSARDTKRDYNGKFKNVDKMNMGQSPGARASVSELYFSTQRYYNVEQGLICDYLNIHRQKKGLSKKALTEMFPSEYKHTVGHWLRKDMGGSIPKIEDMVELEKILGLDKSYVTYANRIGLKLQTVSANIKGKNPGDFLEKTKEELLKMQKLLVSD